MEKPPTRVGLETCHDLYDKLKFEGKRLEDGWAIYDTFNFVVTAHHLYADWIPKRGTDKAKAKNEALPASAQMIMDCIIELSNGSKHWELKEYHKKKQIIKAQPVRAINDWYAYMLAGPMLYVEAGEYKLSMRELRDLVLGYFAWMLDDNSEELPEALTQQLELCRTQSGDIWNPAT